VKISVNFLHASRARGAPERVCDLTVYPSSRTLELLAFDEYCRFDTSETFLTDKEFSQTFSDRQEYPRTSSGIFDWPKFSLAFLTMAS
jgi:hypothetical protein